MRERPTGRTGDQFGMTYEVILWNAQLRPDYADVLTGRIRSIPFVSLGWLACMPASIYRGARMPSTSAY